MELVSGGGEGVEAAPKTPRLMEQKARSAHTASSTRRPSMLRAEVAADCVAGQPAAPQVCSC